MLIRVAVYQDRATGGDDVAIPRFHQLLPRLKHIVEKVLQSSLHVAAQHFISAAPLEQASQSQVCKDSGQGRRGRRAERAEGGRRARGRHRQGAARTEAARCLHLDHLCHIERMRACLNHTDKQCNKVPHSLVAPGVPADYILYLGPSIC